jgi:ABC-2 type transport system ATP-binding protein
VVKLNSQGKTVLYTTHYMEEAQELSHRIGIMDKGKIIAQGSHDELVNIIGALDRILLTTEGPASIEFWRSLDGVEEVSPEGPQTLVLTRDADSLLPSLFEKAREAGVHISSMEVQEPNLEAVFLHLTGRDLRD